MGGQIAGRPGGERISGCGDDLELGGLVSAEPRVQLRDDLEIGDQVRSFAVEPRSSFAPWLMSNG